ncbi:MAG: hypothetical protein H7Y41_00070, partial [Hyphomonadaceae bacterium]|nr:hypothetical protein [Clostridia bacterium]
MYWTRAKWILIILFLGINIFLLTYMFFAVQEQVTVSNATIENTLDILKKN